ncbi:MAG: spore coat protein CotJB [Oscillospiraceae bacterium]|nr:spore coat protein CotJB [Oscillospiraceae bacterium]
MAETPLQSLDTMGKAELMNLTQSRAFAMRDLALYLDTHPTDSNALNQFLESKRDYEKYAKIYSERYGALSMSRVCEENGWPSWSNTPWPWEKEAN